MLSSEHLKRPILMLKACRVTLIGKLKKFVLKNVDINAGVVLSVNSNVSNAFSITGMAKQSIV